MISKTDDKNSSFHVFKNIINYKYIDEIKIYTDYGKYTSAIRDWRESIKSR